MKNLIIVPFDLNTARKIKSGEMKNWIWMLVMPHGFTSPAAATTASTIWGSTYAIVDQNIR